MLQRRWSDPSVTSSWFLLSSQWWPASTCWSTSSGTLFSWASGSSWGKLDTGTRRVPPSVPCSWLILLSALIWTPSVFGHVTSCCFKHQNTASLFIFQHLRLSELHLFYLFYGCWWDGGDATRRSGRTSLMTEHACSKRVRGEAFRLHQQRRFK